MQNAPKTEGRRKQKRGAISTEGSMIDSCMNFNRGSESKVLTTSEDAADASRCSQSTYNRFGSTVMTAGAQPSGSSLDTCPTSMVELSNNLECFDLQKVIGTGSFGKVYLAQNKFSGKFYAIKCLKKDMIKKRNQL